MIILENLSTVIKKSIDVVNILNELLQKESPVDQGKEHFWSIGYDSPKISFIDLVSLGSTGSVVVHLRDLFRLAILKSAANLIFAHNHPHGNPQPGYADVSAAKRFAAAGMILQIPVMDFIIIGKKGALFSFYDQYPIIFKEDPFAPTNGKKVSLS